jgi:large subunit ribosomal protein L20
MARVKRGTISRQKHNKLRNLTKGYRMSRRKLVRKMHEAVLHAGQYAYAGRKNRKSQARRDWILHLNQSLKSRGLRYNEFINKLKLAKIELDRKILARLALENSEVFAKIIAHVK